MDKVIQAYTLPPHIWTLRVDTTKNYSPPPPPHPRPQAREEIQQLSDVLSFQKKKKKSTAHRQHFQILIDLTQCSKRCGLVGLLHVGMCIKDFATTYPVWVEQVFIISEDTEHVACVPFTMA